MHPGRPSLQNRAKIVKNRANPGNLRPKTLAKNRALKKNNILFEKNL
jgi:hypothetical protein